MKYGYFPGCSLHATAKEFNMSTREVCGKLDIQLEEVENWYCCGATPAHTTNHALGVALPYASLQNARRQQLESVVAPCAACYNRLKSAAYETTENPELLSRVQEITGMPEEARLGILHIVELFRDHYGYARLGEVVNRPLTGLKVAAYYGCLLVRPANIMKFDDPETPQAMDNLLTAIGAEAVPWSHKTECCGASHAIPRTDIVLELCKNILLAAQRVGADCIAVACPLCHANLDMRQQQINKAFGTAFATPILYITQLTGIALGIAPEKLGLTHHCVSPEPLLAAKQLWGIK